MVNISPAPRLQSRTTGELKTTLSKIQVTNLEKYYSEVFDNRN